LESESEAEGLFAEDVLGNKEYVESEPYRHSVISSPIDDDLLRAARDETRENVYFTPKETNIYKMY
jgi:hypothetical protein